MPPRAVAPCATPRPDGDARVLRVPRCGLPPTRPPDRLTKPSTLVLKKSVHTRRLDVKPPCEWPTSQNALTLFFPTCVITEVTMFWRYSSSAADQICVGENGV